MAATEHDQVFLEYVVKALVDQPDKVVITRTVDERGVLLELTVDPEDMGKIIGKAGATAKSIRTLLRVLGAKDDARYNLKIVDPEGSEPRGDSQMEDVGEDAPAQDSEQAPEEVQNEESVAEEDTTAEDIKSKAREGLEDLDSDI